MAMTGAERQARYMQRLLKGATVAPRIPDELLDALKAVELDRFAGNDALVFAERVVAAGQRMLAEAHAIAARKQPVTDGPVPAAARKQPVTDAQPAPKRAAVSVEPSVTTPIAAKSSVASKPSVTPAVEVLWRASQSERWTGWTGWIANKHVYSVEPRGQLFQALRRADQDITSWTSTWNALGKFGTVDEAKAACEADARSRAAIKEAAR